MEKNVKKRSASHMAVVMESIEVFAHCVREKGSVNTEND